MPNGGDCASPRVFRDRGMRFGLWRQYGQFYRGSRRALIISSLVSISQVLVLVPIPLLVRKAFDEAIPSGKVGALVVLGLLMLVLQVVSAASSLWTRNVILRTTKAAIQRVREEALHKLYTLPRSVFSSCDQGELHDRVVHETERIDIMTNALLSEFAPAAVLSLGISVVLVTLNWWLFLVTVSLVPAVFAASRLLGGRVKASVRLFHRSFEQFSRGVLFVVRAMDLTHMRAAEEWEFERRRRHLDELRETSGTMSVLVAAYAAIQQTLVAVGGLVVLVVGGVAVGRGVMTMGQLLSFSAGLVILRSQLVPMVVSLPRIMEGGPSLASLFDLLNESAEQPYKGRARIDFKGSISLHDVCFSYSDEPFLLDICLDLRPGRVTAVVGDNGSGKSTIANLILGFYRPQDGRLTADGVPYDAVDVRDLRRAMGVVTQDPIIVPGSVWENITYGVPDAGPEEVAEALRLAMADDFVARLPGGLDADVGEGGTFLSGGQRQRIAVARALLRRPKVLILDEPTNHLDDAGVENLMRNLVAAHDHLAILLISHRTEVVALADEVFRLDAGRLFRADGVLGQTSQSPSVAPDVRD